MTTTISRSSAPNTPEAALRRDKRLARKLTHLVRAQFNKERRRVIRTRGDPDALRVAEWEVVIGKIWAEVGKAIFDPTFVALTSEQPPVEQRASQELVALIARLIRDRGGARTIGAFIDEAALGVVTTSRKRIQTVLRRVRRPSDAREITRALRRLYTTDFVKKRASRVALDATLRATATYEHAAAVLAQEVTGKDYIQIWHNQGDSKVRSTHQSVRPVLLGETFKVGSAELRYPRDPAGPPGETVNCRCWPERRRV